MNFWDWFDRYRPSKTPIEENLSLTFVSYDDSTKKNSDDDKLLSDPTVYRKVIGKLLYLSVTRPDISFIVQNVKSDYASS